jgi:hypothetical protein
MPNLRNRNGKNKWVKENSPAGETAAPVAALDSA